MGKEKWRVIGVYVKKGDLEDIGGVGGRKRP